MVDPMTGETVKATLGSARRLDVIYETNLRTAEAAGRWKQMEVLKKERPYLRYVCMNLPTSRKEHMAWHGLIFPKDHPFWDTHYPPNGWRCRCMVQELSEKDLSRHGLKVSDGSKIPYDGTEPWYDKRNDRTLEVSRGVDPAFNYNAGKVAPEIKASENLRDNLNKLSPELAKALAESPEIKKLLKG